MQQEKKATLFELDGAELDLLNRLEGIFAEPMDETILDPGATAEQMVDEYLAQLAEVQDQLADKLEGYCKAIKSKESRAEMLAAEAKLYQIEANRLAAMARGEDDTAEFLQLRLKAFMEKRGLKEFQTRTHKLKIVHQGGKQALKFAPDVTPDEVGSTYTKKIPAHWEFDKEKIEAALKSGLELATFRPPTEGEEEPRKIVWAYFAERGTKLKIS